jgi:hypothetical protein
MLFTYREQLASCPLYISLDKDVLVACEAAVNWDSGHLTLAEVEAIVRAFVDTSGGKLAGMDIVGDWSAVRTRGLFRRLWHWSEHPRLDINPMEANDRNQRTNMVLLEALSNLSGAAVTGAPMRLAA